MKSTRTALLAMLSFLSIAGVAPARELPETTPEKVGMSSERLARMDRAIHAYVDKGRTPGVITLVARHGKIVHVDTYGLADIASGRKLGEDAIVRMFSMTKPITSVALLMLYEEGKFQLRDPLSQYFPAFADVKVSVGAGPEGAPRLDSLRRPITIQDVFRHTGGFAYGLAANSPVDLAYQKANLFSTSLDDLMTKLATLPLANQPGRRWVYSVSHDVQAALVEKLSGMKFDEFVRQRIFTPLGMKDAMFKVPAARTARVPTLYARGPDGKLVPDTSPLGAGYGDLAFGGYSISTTARDYAIFAQMLLNKGELDGVRLLSPKTVELMSTNHLPKDVFIANPDGSAEASTGYGLGVYVLLDPALRGNLGSVGEFGWSGAASTHFLVDPKEDLIAVYITQLMGGEAALRAEWITLLYQAIVDK